MDLTQLRVSLENVSNEENSTDAPFALPHTDAITALIVLVVAVIVSVTIVGNVLVIVAVLTSRALRAPQNLFLVSLASADILVATLVIPFSLSNEVMGYWYFGSTWCAFYLALDVLFCTSSIVHLCATATGRWQKRSAITWSARPSASNAWLLSCGSYLLSSPSPLCCWPSTTNASVCWMMRPGISSPPAWCPSSLRVSSWSWFTLKSTRWPSSAPPQCSSPRTVWRGSPLNPKPVSSGKTGSRWRARAARAPAAPSRGRGSWMTSTWRRTAAPRTLKRARIASARAERWRGRKTAHLRTAVCPGLLRERRSCTRSRRKRVGGSSWTKLK